jgi:hypothetical protein
MLFAGTVILPVMDFILAEIFHLPVERLLIGIQNQAATFGDAG